MGFGEDEGRSKADGFVASVAGGRRRRRERKKKKNEKNEKKKEKKEQAAAEVSYSSDHVSPFMLWFFGSLGVG